MSILIKVIDSSLYEIFVMVFNFYAGFYVLTVPVPIRASQGKVVRCAIWMIVGCLFIANGLRLAGV